MSDTTNAVVVGSRVSCGVRELLGVVCRHGQCVGEVLVAMDDGRYCYYGLDMVSLHQCKCKECGVLFVPESAGQVYCDEDCYASHGGWMLDAE